MGRHVLTKREKKRRSASSREDRISEGLAAVEDARRRHSKQGAAAILLAANIKASPATVHRRRSGGRSIQDAAAEKANLTPAEEQELAVDIQDASDRRKGYRPRKILKLAVAIAQARDPQGPASMFGKNWVSRYLSRHNLRKYLSKKISNERSQSVHPRNVKEYFEVLEERQEQRQYKPRHKHGMDESPGMLGNGDALVVVGPVGKKAQYAERDGNRRSYTIVATICADGTATVKPWFIFKAKGFARSWAENNSLDAHIARSDSGYMNGDLMLGWMQEFHRQTKPDDPSEWRQLAYDLHKSHIDERVIEYAWKHKIDCISYPTNATQIFQGLDICIFGPFKRALDELKYEHEEQTGTGLTFTTLLKLIDKPWNDTFTYENVISAFRKSGFEPIDHSIVSKDQMKNSAQTHVAGEERYNPALKAVLPLVRELKHQNAVSNTFTDHENLPGPVHWPINIQASAQAAREGLESSQMGWLLGSSSDATSNSVVYDEPLGRLPSTPESIRSKERAARRAVNRNWDEPDYEKGYDLMTQANDELRARLAACEAEIDAHNANHALNQATIVQQKSHLCTREQRAKGPVAELIGTKDQYWITGGSMRRAVRRQNRAARRKGAAKNQRTRKRDAAKNRQQARADLTAHRVDWRKSERVDRATQIEEDRQAWLAQRTPEQVLRDRQPPKNPQGRRKAGTPLELQDLPTSEEEEEDMEEQVSDDTDTDEDEDNNRRDCDSDKDGNGDDDDNDVEMEQGD